jgi:hypothetical protein
MWIVDKEPKSVLTSCVKASKYVILDDMTAIDDPSRRMPSFASTGRSLVSRHVAWFLHLIFSTRHWMTLDVELSGVPPGNTMCFTICLFISPDLDGYRHPKMKHGMFLTTRRRASGNGCNHRVTLGDGMFHDMFVHYTTCRDMFHDMFVH